MTRAPRRATLTFSNVDDVAAVIRADGGRLSSACRVVLSALFSADGPISAEYIAGGRGGAGIRTDLSSVYRNLERLEELGVVHHVHISHGPGLYALEGNARREYLVCERCTRVDSVDASRLNHFRAAILKRFGYDVRFDHFPIVGLCPACIEEQPLASDAAADAARSRRDDRHDHHHGDDTHASSPTEPTRADQTEHSHEHSHGDYIHAHPHVH